MRARSPVAMPISVRPMLSVAACLVSLLAALALSASVLAQEAPEQEDPTKTGDVPYVPPLTQQQRTDIIDAIDSGRTLRHIERLSSYHRPAPSPGLDRAMRYIARELRAAGLQDVETITYESNGKKAWWVEPAPPAWTCDRAELWIEKPDRTQLADWSGEPLRVATYSTSCDLTADLVEVTDWDQEKLDVKGKIVLTTGPARLMHAKAVQAGAAGLLLAPPDSITDDKLRMAVHASSLSPDMGDWGTNRFAFNISGVEADIIRTALDKGTRVRVKALIENARTSAATAPIVTGWIRPDRPTDSTVLLIAEVAGPKPGANGVSGAATLLSVARSYIELVEDGAFIQPGRSIQLLFVPDLHGARAYIEKRRPALADVVAVIHLGIVGTNAEDGPFKARPLSIADGGWLLKTGVPYLPLNFGRYCAQTRLIDVAGSEAPFPMLIHVRGPVNAHSVFYGADLAIPTASISYLPDEATNTSIDTTAMLDATALTRTSFITLGTAYVLATPVQWELERFGPVVGAYCMHDLHGGLTALGMSVLKVPKERLVETFQYADAVMRSHQARTKATAGDSLRILVPAENEDSADQFSASATATFNERADSVVRVFEARREEEGVTYEEVQGYSKRIAELRREAPSMRWRGPITPGLLERQAPSVLPIPDAVDVTALFALVNGSRVLYDLWGEHEALKWVGFPVKLPPPDQFRLPTPADVDTMIEFLRRCEQAGVIRIGAPIKTE